MEFYTLILGFLYVKFLKDPTFNTINRDCFWTIQQVALSWQCPFLRAYLDGQIMELGKIK